MGRQAIDMTNQRFGRLVCQNKIDIGGSKTARWLCLCDCGNNHISTRGNLVTKMVTSCGCFREENRKENSRKANWKHGYSVNGNSTYGSWEAMRQRCNNPNSEWFHRYGGRGIKICKRWNIFANFLADMGERPDGKTLDRKNNEGDYEPSNCRWATPLEQANNK